MKVLEVTRVTPPFNSPKSTAEFSLPLTFSDIFWLKLHPKSLSLTLPHYLPLAGNLKWPSNAPKPIILYTPNDGVSLTVAESNADFNLLSSNGIYEAVELHHLTPELITSDDSATAIALQITFFPHMGFCIGITTHHAVLDELSPFLDRSIFKGPDGLDMLYLNQWLASMGSDSDVKKKSLNILPNKGEAPNLVRATFEITREDFNKLRERVSSKLSDDGKELHLSSFVLAIAHITTCIVKARGGDGDRNVAFGFVIDCRPRLKPPVPENYFGNCNTGSIEVVKARDLLGENGFAFAVQKVSSMVKEVMEKGVLEGIEKKLSVVLNFTKELAKPVQIISVAGSPRFDVYESDFGLGKPLKVVVVSIDKDEAISMAESRDGSKGVEAGLALKKHEMENFYSLFLKDL
ncbi:hypothetical protein REPUB_Repub09cG0056600 [Reevesia pubescens]